MTFPVDVVCRGLLCIVLGTSGCAKLFTKGSVRSLSHEFSELIPWAGLRTPLAIGLVASELSILLLLLSDPTYRAGFVHAQRTLRLEMTMTAQLHMVSSGQPWASLLS